MIAFISLIGLGSGNKEKNVYAYIGKGFGIKSVVVLSRRNLIRPKGGPVSQCRILAPIMTPLRVYTSVLPSKL